MTKPISMTLKEFSKLTISQVADNFGVSIKELAESVQNTFVVDRERESELTTNPRPKLKHLMLDELDKFPIKNLASKRDEK